MVVSVTRASGVELFSDTGTADYSNPQIMGVLNVTPDSFSDGGKYFALGSAVAHARHMCDEGASIIDVGGESSRPGSKAISAAEEMERVLPVIERIKEELDVLISVDTSKPEVMSAAVAVGAKFINDVRALRTEGALEAAASLGVPVCLMHMQGEPRTMQIAPRYQNVVREVGEFLEHRARVCETAGMPSKHIVIDPGFGFGKTLKHNLTLMAHLDSLTRPGRPVLVGVSRKSMIEKILRDDADDRVTGSVGLAMFAALKGAAILRVHDVKPTADALAVLNAVSECRRAPNITHERQNR